MVARGGRGAHQQGGLVVGVDHDGRRLLRGTREHLFGLGARPARPGAIGLGLGHQPASLLAEHGEVGGEPLRLLPGLRLQLVGDLLGTGEQRRGGGPTR